MPDVHVDQLAREVEVTLSVFIPKARPFGARYDERGYE
jgi:hypothetical protein